MFSNLARRAFVAFAIMQSAAAFAPMPMKNVKSSTALNEFFEVHIGTGVADAKGTNGEVTLTLYDGNTSYSCRPMKDQGGDQFHEGSMDCNSSCDYPGISKPDKFKIVKTDGNKWKFDSVMVTNIRTGECFKYRGTHELEDDQVLEKSLTLQGDANANVKTFKEFDMTFTIGDPGTNALVYVKMIDAQGRASAALRPGAATNLNNPWNDFAQDSTQTCKVQVDVGEDGGMGDPEKVLLYIKKNKESNPKLCVSKLTITGCGMGAQSKTFIPGGTLRENEGKYRYMDAA